MAANLELVPAAAGKRPGAEVLDWLAPVAVLLVTFAVGFAGITRRHSGGFISHDTGSLVLFGGIGLGLTLVYPVVPICMEGRSGKTLGNHAMGIRSADKDGYNPGGGGVFPRSFIAGAGTIPTLLAVVAIAMFNWFDVDVFILGLLLLFGAAWAVLVVVSNTWDRNGRLRGWHDYAVKTLVFDVNDGRDPITSGGIQGPYSFAPLNLPPVQQVASPLAGAAKPPHAVNAQAPVAQPPVQPFAPQPYTALPSSAPPSCAPEPYAAPVAVLRISPDDGRDFPLDRNVLLGRKPLGQAGERQAQLLTDCADSWVAYRNPTNCCAITTPNARRTPLQPGVPAFFSPGSTVHFGDRSFHRGQA